MYLPAIFNTYDVSWMVERYNNFAVIAAELRGEGDTPEEMVELDAIEAYMQVLKILILSKEGEVARTSSQHPGSVQTRAFSTFEEYETWLSEEVEKFRLFELNQDEMIAEWENYLSGN